MIEQLKSKRQQVYYTPITPSQLTACESRQYIFTLTISITTGAIDADKGQIKNDKEDHGSDFLFDKASEVHR